MEKSLPLKIFSKLLKFKPFIKSLKLELLILGSLVLSSSLTCRFKESLDEDLAFLASDFSFVSSLQKDKRKLNFIASHSFKTSEQSPDQFTAFIKEESSKVFMKLSKFNLIATESESSFKKNIYEIELLAWHDSFIFSLIDQLYSFSPGFVSIEKIHIERISNINEQTPSLKVGILCTLFYK